MEIAGPRGKSKFAKEIGVSPSTYDYYEKGRLPPLDMLIRIAEYANADLGWLMTGREGKEAVRASHPAVARIAKLLADRPDFAAPLAAFVDLLSQTAAAFPAPAAVDSGAEPVALESAGDQKSPSVAPTAADVGLSGQPLPNRPAAPPRQAGIGHPPADIPAPPALSQGPAIRRPVHAGQIIRDVAGRVAAPGLSERQGWIPILGRSAAGIPHFWRETGGSDGGATALADLVSRMRPRKARRVHQARAVGELAADGSTAQLVLLDAPEPPGTAEFVIAEHIARRYDVVFAVRIDGASMAPEILHGDVVILSPSCPAEQGKPAVVQLAGQIGVTCKLFRVEGDRVHLIPINESFSPTDHPLAELAWALAVIARVRPA